MYNKFLDEKKALEAILYVAQKTHDLFHIVKVLFYADKYHLEKYGRFISGDCYIAMPEGPVPSGAYDIIKCARGDLRNDDQRITSLNPSESLDVTDKFIIAPLRDPDLDYLSESDIECLNLAINNYANMDHNDLWNLVHSELSYKKSKLNKPIKFNDILESLPNYIEVLDYLDC